MKVERIVMLGADAAPGGDALKVLLGARGPLHRLQNARMGVLKRHVEVGKDLALGHELDHVVDRRIGIDVVQAHPGIKFAQFLAKLKKALLHGAPLDKARAVLEVKPVGAGVLADDEKLLDAAFGRGFGLP